MAKRKRKPVMKADAMKQRVNSIGATQVRITRGEIVTQAVQFEREDGTKMVVHHVDRVQDYLARYKNQGHISDLQWGAGDRFADDCNHAEVGIPSSLGAINGEKPSSVEDRCRRLDRHEERGMHAHHHARRRDEAITALGSGLAPIALWVCRDGKSALDWAVQQGKPSRDGIAALRLALDTLVMHYGLTRAATIG